MASPTTEQNAVLELYQALFNAAAGSIKMNTYLVGYKDMPTLAAAMMNDPAWAASGYGSDPAGIYARFVSNLFGGYVSVTDQANIVNILVSNTGTGGYTVAQVLGLITDRVYSLDWKDNASLDAASKAFKNKVAVDAYYSIDKNGKDANAEASANVDNTDASVTAAESLIGDNGVISKPTTDYILTDKADLIPGSLGNDTITGTNLTLTAGDKINWGGGGDDTLKVSSTATTDKLFSGFEMTGIKNLVTTADIAGVTNTYDLSGATGITLLSNLNSVGSIFYNQVTSVADLKVENITAGADMTVAYQDSKVVGADSIKLALVNNYNSSADTNVLRIGKVTDNNSGIETITADVTVATTSIRQLDSDITKLVVTGDQTFEIGAAQRTVRPLANITQGLALNNTVTEFDSTASTGNMNMTFQTAAKAMSIKTGSGVDTIDMDGSAAAGVVTSNATISLGANNDVLYAGKGDDTIDLGEGNDTAYFLKEGITVTDEVTGGAGLDTIIQTQSDTLRHSEAERVKNIEVFTMWDTNTRLEVGNHMIETVDAASASSFTVNMAGDATSGIVVGNITDITNLSFSNTGKLTANGGVGVTTAGARIGDDTVIANDATVNAKATISFKDDGWGAGFNKNGADDVLQVIDGGNLNSDDFTNITGLDTILLSGASSIAQTWDIQINPNMIDKYDSTTGAVGDATDTLYIKADRNVPQGSRLNLDSTKLAANQQVLVQTNANMVIYVDGTLVRPGEVKGAVTVQSSLEFTENADRLIGAGTFTGDSLDQFDSADYVSATGLADVLQLNFAINNKNFDVDEQLNYFDEDAAARLEVLTFNTQNDVAFKTIQTAAGGDQLSGIRTVNFMDGNDTVAGNTQAATFNFAGGNNSYTAAAIVAETVNTDAGADTFIFDTDELTAGDTIKANKVADNRLEGKDTVKLTNALAQTYLFGDAGGLNGSAKISGIDQVDYTETNAAGGLVVNNRTLAQQYSATNEAATNNNMVFNISDANAAVNTVSIFNATEVVAGNSVTANVTGLVGAAGLASHVADVKGGAGADALTIGGGVVGYVVQGNSGADTINITNSSVSVGVRFETANDGGREGAADGYDVVTGFHAAVQAVGHSDVVMFDTTAFAATNHAFGALPTANAKMVVTTDAPINISTDHTWLGYTDANVMHLTQSNGGGITDADLNNLEFVATRINTTGVHSQQGDAAIVIANGQTQSAVYYYLESGVGTSNASKGELKILGFFDSNKLAGDVAVNATAGSTDLLFVDNGGGVGPQPGGYTNVTLPVPSTVQKDLDNLIKENVILNVVTAKAQAPDTQIPVNNFQATLVGAPITDMFTFDLATANAATTLAAMNGIDAGNGEVVTVTSDAINTRIVVNFGSDLDGNPVTVTILGQTDATAVAVSVI